MMGPLAQRLPGNRLHLQHGPIDLVIGADGAREAAFRAAEKRFRTVLGELVPELPLLRTALSPGSPRPTGRIARTMERATRPHEAAFITPMAAVAGAVADTILAAMRQAGPLQRAYVNNGGDIALWLAPGARFVTAMACHDGRDLGRIEVTGGQGIGGIATSGRHGRSLSMGIADSVTVLAESAAMADAAATLVANAVDLPGHAAIRREPACEMDSDSDLGARPVVTGLGFLTREECARALAAGLARARAMERAGLIRGAALTLGGVTRTTGRALSSPELIHA